MEEQSPIFCVASFEKKLPPLYDIEEPKTLSDEEMDRAREAALEVIKNNTPVEATKLFLQGLQPVEVEKPNLYQAFDFDQEEIDSDSDDSEWAFFVDFDQNFEHLTLDGYEPKTLSSKELDLLRTMAAMQFS